MATSGVAHSEFGPDVGHVKPDGSFVGNVGVASGPTGVAVDGAGKIWSSNFGARRLSRIDPTKGPLGPDGVTRVGAVDFTSVDMGGTLYNYSDMTGSTLRGAPDNGTWSFAFDSTRDGAEWGKVSWNGRVCGDGALTVTAASSAGTTFGAPVVVRNGEDFDVANGRHLKVSVAFKRSSRGESPLLYDITVATADYVIDAVANRAPEVSAGPDRTTTLPNPIRVTGSACDDGRAMADGLALAWSKVSGPGRRFVRDARRRSHGRDHHRAGDLRPSADRERHRA